MDFEKKVLETIEKYNMLSQNDTVVVGLSGGADSVALFLVLCALKERFNLNLIAAHVNHMIRGNEAQRDCDYARKIALDSGVPFHLLECNVPALAKEEGISTEAAGRNARYAFFKKIAPEGKIAVAHHMADSVETTLINLIRGASLKGLRGILPVNQNVIRPLILCTREEIEDYLKTKNTSFMTDSTNRENIYTRNIIRNTIIPQMEKINPNFISTVFENSLILKDEEDLIVKILKDYEEKLIIKKGGCVCLKLTEDLNNAIKRRLVISCFKLLGSDMAISNCAVENVLSLSTGKKTLFSGVCVTRSYDELIFSEDEKEAKSFSVNITQLGNIKIEETGKTYNFEIASKEDITEFKNGFIYLDAHKLGDLTMRNRHDGDLFYPLGLGGKKKVKDFLIDLKIPKNQRDTLPVLESNGVIAAIGCLRADDAYKVTNNTKKILIISEVATNE